MNAMQRLGFARTQATSALEQASSPGLSKDLSELEKKTNQVSKEVIMYCKAGMVGEAIGVFNKLNIMYRKLGDTYGLKSCLLDQLERVQEVAGRLYVLSDVIEGTKADAEEYGAKVVPSDHSINRLGKEPRPDIKDEDL